MKKWCPPNFAELVPCLTWRRSCTQKGFDSEWKEKSIGRNEAILKTRDSSTSLAVRSDRDGEEGDEEDYHGDDHLRLWRMGWQSRWLSQHEDGNWGEIKWRVALPCCYTTLDPVFRSSAHPTSVCEGTAAKWY